MPGRFEPVEEGQPFGVLVDYAHTPDSLENVLRAARELTEGRLHVVFGAGGDRDRGKRPLMGEVAARLADRVIVTSDNPRSEEPGAIVDEIVEGAGPGVEVEVDRRRAIALALGGAQAGDVVVIAGKGHEQGQEFEGGRKEPFDDRDGRARGPSRAGRGDGVIDRTASWVAEAAGGELVSGEPDAPGPVRAVVDTRETITGDLFVGLRGERADGGEHAPAALEAGAWGVLVAPEHAERAMAATAGAAPVIVVRRPAGRAAVARALLAAGARLQGPGRDRLHRQDLDEGHPRGGARRRICARTPTARTSTPRSGCR